MKVLFLLIVLAGDERSGAGVKGELQCWPVPATVSSFLEWEQGRNPLTRSRAWTSEPGSSILKGWTHVPTPLAGWAVAAALSLYHCNEVSLTAFALVPWIGTVPTLSKWVIWSSEPQENYYLKHQRIARILAVWAFVGKYSGLLWENSFFRIFRKNSLHSSNVETVLNSKLELGFCARLLLWQLLNILHAHGIASSRRSLGKT